MTDTAITNEGATASTETAAAVPAEGTAPQTVVAGAETAAAAGEAETAPGAVRPEGLPDEFWDAATNTVKTGDVWSAYRDLKAAQDAKLADVPAADGAYDLALPEGFETPEGLSVEIKADDPLWADFQSIAREASVPKADFQKFVGAFAKYQIAAQQADVDSYVAEKAALGANADTRIKAASDWMAANLKSDEAEALGGSLISAAGVRALERIFALKSGPVAATGAGANNVQKFDGLQGESLLHAIRLSKAA